MSFDVKATAGSRDALQRYCHAALYAEVARVEIANEGERNDKLNRAAFSVGTLLHAGCFTRGEAEEKLLAVALGVGLEEAEAVATIRSGLDAGQENPRDLSSIGQPKPWQFNGRASSEGTGGKEAPGPSGDKEKYTGPVLIWADTITPRPVEWLWPGVIPLGKLTTFAGNGGLGKTFVACDVIARVTTGTEWPYSGGECAKPGKVILVSGEDDPDDTLVPRLIEQGADLSQVAFFAGKVLETYHLGHLERLDQAVQEIGTRGGNPLRLIAIDPPTSYLAGVDDHKNSELRSLLGPLKEWAQRHRVAVVLITHVNKASGQKVDALARVMGSVAWVNAVRSAHLFAKDPDAPNERRLFVGMKSNLGKERKGLAYRILPVDADRARVDWLGEVDTTADEASQGIKAQPRRVVARDWLIDAFRAKLEWPSDELFRAAAQEGLSRDALFEGKRILDLPRARRVCAQNGSVSWVWWVPEDWPHLKEEEPAGDGEVEF